MDLFETSSKNLLKSQSPLADRMRPRTLSEYIGQKAILGKGRLLRRAIEADRLSSLIFYGPPGCGKTTLAKIIANTTKSHFITINAVLAGKADIVQSIQEAQNEYNLYSRRTILFVDEVHRFNKAQQDALLPHVESGTLILIGATTENPYFEVNKALVSRSRIFRLVPLGDDDLRQVLFQAMNDCVRGYGNKKIRIDDDAVIHLCRTANGDARSVLNAIELAVETTPENEDKNIHITLEIAQESIQKRAVLYDKDGDAHYDIISAFIKSVRGSDADAALFWLAKMVYAGEDPRFIFRRMIILASEDVGLADPLAIQVVMNCAAAYDYVGMPEGRYHLTQACLYLSTAPKSNSAMAFFDAVKSIEEEDKADDIPNALRDSSRDGEDFGHGDGYLYPHAYRDHWINQQYLPDNLRGKVFYMPSNQGYEAKIAEEVQRRREIQIAANSFETECGVFAQSDTLLFERTLSGLDKYAENVRRDFFETANIKPDDLTLDINCGSNGFFTLEALRCSSAGGVWAYALSKEDAQNFENFTKKLSYFAQPIIRFGEILQIGDKIDAKFDCIIGRGVLALIEKDFFDAFTEQLHTLLEKNGRIVFAQYVPGDSTLLSDFVCEKNKQTVKTVENEVFEKTLLGKFSPDLISQIFTKNDFNVNVVKKQYCVRRKISVQVFDNWFRNDENSFGNVLKKRFGEDDCQKIKEELKFSLASRETEWKQANFFWEIKTTKA
ncbi:MAG: AAA family ATPase [Chitinispirillales bacterium]|jgi:putative ATPase|nr:AAA family ATPase [Chitinispirillales bacterium]